MKAVLCKSFDGATALEISETEPPQPAEDEILIEVHAAPVSYYGHAYGTGPLPVAARIYPMSPAPMPPGS